MKKFFKVILNDCYIINTVINEHSSFLNINSIYILISKSDETSSAFYLMQYLVFYNEKKMSAEANILKFNKFNYHEFILKVIKKFINLQENEE